MPRRGNLKKREILPDAEYNSITLAKFVNKLMMRGQKATANRIIYSALATIREQTKRNPLEVLEQAIKNATPLLRVRPRRVAGATYQVPVEVPAQQAFSLAVRWLISSARNRKGRSMAEKLAAELMDAYQGQGATVKRREDIHKMAESNRAFVHYRW